MIANKKLHDLQAEYSEEFKNLRLIEKHREFITEEALNVIIEVIEIPTITYFFTDLLLFTERDLKSNSFKFLKYIMINYQSQVHQIDSLPNGFLLQGTED